MQRAMASNKNGAVMEEAFLSRFDGLPVRVRKVLQTCAVLGLSFALSDVIRVHPELQEVVVENALGSAVDEMVLIEQVEEDDDVDDVASFKSNSTGESGESMIKVGCGQDRKLPRIASSGSHAMAKNARVLRRGIELP
jgi:hypothetical protein